MNNFHFKKVLKFALFILMLFSCVNIVSADSVFNKAHLSGGDTRNEPSCSEGNNCIKICEYALNPYDDDDAILIKNYSYGKNDFIEKSYVGYFFNNSSWDITFNSTVGAHINIFEGDLSWFEYYLVVPNHLPTTHIYWADYGNDQTWDKAPIIEGTSKNAYYLLQDDFYCPEYLSFDDFVNFELCYANDSSTCLNQKSASFKKSKLHQLSYSFRLDYMKIANATYDNLKYDLSSEVTDSSKNPNLDFLKSIDDDSEFKYDSTLPVKENVLNNCDYFSKKLSNYDMYISKIVNKDNKAKYINNYLNPTLSTYAEKYSTKIEYNYIYNYDSLYSLLNLGENQFRKIGMSNDKSVFEQMDHLFSDTITYSLKYIGSVCDSSKNTNIQLDSQLFNNLVQEKYYELAPKVVIDFESEYDCGFLNGISDIISTGYFIIEIIGVVILIGFSILDYAKVIFNGDQDQMKKTNNRFIQRIIILAILFLLPGVLNLVLKIFKIQGFNTENPLCVEIKNR